MARKILLYGFLLFFSCCLSSQLSAQYILELDSVQAFPGDQVSLGISIQNAGPVTSFQCDIPLPSAVGIDPQSVELNPARSVDHLISATIVQDTVLRILCFSMNNTPFNGNQGEVATFELSLPAIIMDAPLPLTNALIANVIGQNVITASHDGAIQTMGPLSVEILATADSLCLGTTITLEASVSGGGWHPVFSWSSDPPGYSAVGASVIDEPESSQLYIVNVDDGFQTAADTHAIVVFEPPWVEAGEDQLICFGETVGLNAAFGGADSLLWSGGNGSFDDPNSATTVYVPSPEDLTLTEIWLTVQAFGSMLCEQATDSLLLSLSSPALADAGADYVVPLNAFYENTDAMISGADSLFWTSSGDGSFDNASLLHPTYLPGTRDVLNGEVRLRLHAIPSAPCEAVSDSLQLIVLREGDNIMQLPALSANPNDTIILSLDIENRTTFNSFNCSMLLPEGMSWIVSTAQLTNRAADHQLSLEQTGQQLNCTAASPTNQAFNGNTGSVLQIQIITSMLPGSYPLEIIGGSMINEIGNEVLTDLVNGELILLIVGEDQFYSLESPLELRYFRQQQQLEIILKESCELHLALYSLSGYLTGEIHNFFSKGIYHIALKDIEHRHVNTQRGRIIRVSMHQSNQVKIYKTLKLW
jgi:hypothetical protein